jgi:hypothetical protein
MSKKRQWLSAWPQQEKRKVNKIMKKSEPKIILNLSVENSELDEKIKVAMDKYVEQSVYAQLDEAIEKIVDKRISKLLNSHCWDPDHKINGMIFEQFVRSKTEDAIKQAIEKNAKEILAKKLASLI